MPEKLTRGKARVQFIACKELIEELLDKGETLRGAHRILIKDNKITMSYASMLRLYSGASPLRTQIKMKSPNGKDKEQETKPEIVSPHLDKNNPAKEVKATINTKFLQAGSNKSSAALMRDADVDSLIQGED